MRSLRTRPGSGLLTLLVLACVSTVARPVAAMPVVAQAVQVAPDEAASAIAAALLDLSHPPTFDCNEVLARGIRIVEQHAASPATSDLVLRILALADRADTSPTIWPKIQGLLGIAALHGTAVHDLRSALALRASHLGDAAKYRELSPRAEYALAALAIGPFGDRLDDGFGRHELPEFALPPFDAKLEGRFGAPVSWRLVEARPLATRLELEPRGLGSKGRGTQFGLIQVDAQETRQAFVQLTCNGSHEAWWNGSKIASIHRVVDRGPTRQYHGILLRKGWNHLLIKCSEPNASSFSARFTDEGDRAITEPALRIETKAELHEIAPVPDVDVAAPMKFVDSFAWLEARLAERDNAIVRAAAYNLRARDGFGDEGLGMVRTAFEASRSNMALRAALMATWRLARHVPTDVQSSAIRRLLDETSSADREQHAYVFYRYLDQLVADDKKEDAMRLCDERLAKSPGEAVTLDKRMRIAQSLGWDSEARRSLEKLTQVASQPAGYLRDLANVLAREGAPRRALEVAQKALAQRPGDPALLRAATSLAQRTGQRELALAYIDRRFESEPDAPAKRLLMAGLAIDERRLPDGIALLEEALAETPDDPDLIERLTKLYYRSGNEAKALELGERCLEVRPERHELRHWMTMVRGTSRFPELEPWRLDVDAAISSFAMSDIDKSTPTTLVLDQMVVRVYEDGSQMEETHVLRHINDARGVEASESAEAAAAADELLALRTITPDGASWLPHRVEGSFTMPRLAPGVFIEEQYRNTKGSPGLGPIDFVNFFFRGTDKPYRFSRLVVVMPAKQSFGDFVMRVFPKEAVQVQELGELRAWIFLRENQTPIAEEPSMPPITELAPSVSFGRDEALAPALRLWRNQFEALTLPYVELRNAATEICRGKSDDTEKAKAIHDFVHQHCPDASQRSGSPAPVSVLLKREGPRFWLELALLSCADIAWKAAAIRPYAPGFDPDPEPLLRSADRYAARGAMVFPRGGEPYWLIFGAPRWTPFAELPTHFGESPTSGCPYLLLEGDVGVPGILDGPGTDDLAEFRVDARVTLREGNAAWTAEITMPSSTGLRLKEQTRTMPADRRQQFAQQLAGYFFRGSLTLGRIEWLELDDVGTPFRMRMHLLGRRALRQSGSSTVLTAPIPPTGFTRAFGGREARVHPFVITTMQVQDWVLRIDPAEQSFAEVPAGRSEQVGPLTWSLSYEYDGKDLIVRRKTILRPGRIEAKDYSDFLRACRRIDDAETSVLRLR